jgi:O-antigen/teichoic acid export membrane protein
MRSLTTLMALAAPLLVTLSLFSDQVISILYDTRYANAGVVLCLVSIRGLFRIISVISGSTLLAFGMPRCETIAMGVSLTTLLITLPAGIHYYDIAGALGAILVTAISGMIVQCLFIIRKLKFPVKALAIPMTQAAMVAAVSLGGHALLRPWLAEAHRWRSIPYILAIFILAAGVSFVCWRMAQRAVPPGSTGETTSPA